MDFKQLILEGYYNNNSRFFLCDYFVRKCKLALRDEFFQKDYFFGLLEFEVLQIKKFFLNEVNKRKSEINKIIVCAKQTGLYPKKTQNQTLDEFVNELLQEFKNLTPFDLGYYRVREVFRLDYNLSINYEEVLYIEQELKKAKKKLKINI